MKRIQRASLFMLIMIASLIISIKSNASSYLLTDSSYPYLIFYTDAEFHVPDYRDSATIGDTYRIKMKWYPRYKYEGFELKIIDINKKVYGKSSSDWTNTSVTNTSASAKKMSVKWETANFNPGRYYVYVTPKFFVDGSWHKFSDDFLLIVDLKEKSDDANTVVTGVKLNKKSADLQKGKSLTLKATIAPSNATNQNVTWTSSNKNVATVNKNGKVRAIKAGSTVITVTTEDGNKTAACKVTVLEPVKSIKFNKKTYSVKKGKTVNLKYTIKPKNASNKTVSFSSSDTKIATVDKNGKVYGKKKGQVTITVTTNDGKKSANCTVKVK